MKDNIKNTEIALIYCKEGWSMDNILQHHPEIGYHYIIEKH